MHSYSLGVSTVQHPGVIHGCTWLHMAGPGKEPSSHANRGFYCMINSEKLDIEWSRVDDHLHVK